MKKIIILIPVFNDWSSLIKLLEEIDRNIKDFKNINFECLVINDASTIEIPKLLKPKNMNSLKVLNMKKNQGHARCIAFGLNYVCPGSNFDFIILMDGDGEDRPIEIKSLINKILDQPEKSVVAKRVKRSEGPFFQLLYNIHKVITLLFTGKKINFGNYSCLTKKDAEKISEKSSLWSSYSGTVKKNIDQYNEVDSIRGLRYFGPSQMSLIKLLIHSFSIIGVFKYIVLLRSVIITIIFTLISKLIGFSLIVLQISVIFFCIIIFIVSLRESQTGLKNCQNNLKNIKDITL